MIPCIPRNRMIPVANTNETAKEYREENKKMVRTQGTSTWRTQTEEEKPVKEAFMEGRGNWGKSSVLEGNIKESFKGAERASLVAQWLRIRLPMQGTRVRALVREDPTCCGATKPAHHNYWACALEPTSHNYWSPCPWSLCSATREATAMRSPHTTTKSSPHSPPLEKARSQQWRPNAAKNK